MAYGLKNIPVIDQKPSTALGVKVPFAAPNAFTSVYTTKEQLKYNMINYFLTDRRERVFNPNFGAGLRRRLFEPIDFGDLQDLKQSIINQVQAYFPLVTITLLDITAVPDEGAIKITFNYTVPSMGMEDSITLQIQNM
jgi:phage baseplate assembly protein W